MNYRVPGTSFRSFRDYDSCQTFTSRELLASAFLAPGKRSRVLLKSCTPARVGSRAARCPPRAAPVQAAMAFLFGLHTPAPPPLPAPRRVLKEHITNWIGLQCTLGDTSGDTCYADYDQMTVFDSDKNFAYNARVLFKNELVGDE